MEKRESFKWVVHKQLDIYLYVCLSIYLSIYLASQPASQPSRCGPGKRLLLGETTKDFGIHAGLLSWDASNTLLVFPSNISQIWSYVRRLRSETEKLWRIELTTSLQNWSPARTHLNSWMDSGEQFLPCLIKEGKNSMVGCNIIGGLYGSFIHTLWHTRGSMRPLKKKYHGMDKLKKQTIKDQILKLADENINEL